MSVTAAALPRPAGAGYDRQFYSGMSIAAAVVVLIGFGPTYYLRGGYQSTPLPAYLHVHGFVFTAWMVLFIVQAALISARRTDVHRKLGWTTAALAAVMVVVGTTAGIVSMRRQAETGLALQAQAFLTTPLFSMAMFAAFVAAAIARRRDAQTHKRLMLLATISILDAAVARLPIDVLRTSSWAYLPATDLFLAAAIAYDVASRRTVHPAYIWGGLLLVIEQALRIPVGETALWQSIAHAIIGGGA
jgi:hypothetical protein